LQAKEEYFNSKIETMTRHDLDEIQKRRFRHTLHAAAQSSIYRRAFAGIGLKLDDIQSIEDLRKKHFFTTKEDLRLVYPFGALAVDRNKVVEIHSTSGTTGTPTLGLHTAKDLEDWGEIAARSLVMSGLTSDDVFQITAGLGMFSGGYGFYHGARKVGCTIVPASAGFSKRQIQFMVDFKTTMICAIVSYAFRLAEVAKEDGIEVREQTKVRKGIFGSENWTRETKKRIAKMWDMDPFDIYGFTELYGPGVGNDCKYHDGLHMWEDYFLVEVIDPETGEVLGPEETGELVFTTLAKEAMPLLRYRSRDLSFLFDSRSCDCGRTHRRYKEIIGRSDDMVKVSGVNFWPSEIEAVLLKEPDLSHEYKITISRTRDLLDRMAIEIESNEKIEDISRIEALSKKLLADIRNLTMLSPEIKIVEPNSLPRIEVGKKERVFDERRV
jgi:phenylacetate-CoA ligase